MRPDVIRGILLGVVLCTMVLYGPLAYRAAHAEIFPRPEEIEVQQKAKAERQAQSIAGKQADTEARTAEVNGNLEARHPGCTFDDLGGYHTPDGVMHPIFGIFCPGQSVTTGTRNMENHIEGRIDKPFDRPESTTTDTPAERQVQ